VAAGETARLDAAAAAAEGKGKGDGDAGVEAAAALLARDRFDTGVEGPLWPPTPLTAPKADE
jgi:hypothetical protein